MFKKDNRKLGTPLKAFGQELYMFAYAIIAFELAILYTVFWYVFLREPQPYSIKGNPWGGYNSQSGTQSSGERERQLLSSFAQAAQVPPAVEATVKSYNEQAIYEEWNLDVPMTPSQLVRCRQKGVHVAQPSGNDQKSSTFAGQFLAKLGDSLNRINVKIP